jgi:transposase
MKDPLKPYLSVIEQDLSIRAAARILKIPPMTAWRRLSKVKNTGSLVHGNTGNHNHKPRTDKGAIIELANSRYSGFGITHICELLASREGILVNRETLRRWLSRPKAHKCPKQRQRRECSPNFGDMLQIDGSFHEWFGDRKSCMINIVDDATNTAELRFDGQETIEAACRCAWNWFRKYGVPHAFYADGRNMYHLNPEAGHNFFTAMCRNLGIRVIMAHSPQAKGRVERFNGIHQRRLIPLMKLDGVKDMADANRYLENYMVEHNRRYSRPAREGNSHRPLPDWAKSIDDVCFITVERILNNDWTFQYNGKTYLLPRQSNYPPAKAKLLLNITLSGHITASYRCTVLSVR